MCHSEFVCALYADKELPAAEARDVEQHLAECPLCRSLVGRLREENCALAGLAVLDVGEPAPRPQRLRTLASVGCAAAAAMLVAAPLQWVARSLPIRDWLFQLALQLPALLRKSAPFALVLGLLLACRMPAGAIVPLTGDRIAIGPAEVIHDSVFAAADTVVVEGVVDGDLFAFGRTVEVRGTVKGDLIAWAQEVRVTGSVEGSVACFAQTAGVAGHIGRRLYSFVQTLQTAPGSRIDSAVLAAAQTVDLAGTVGGSVTSHADHIVLRTPVRIAGSVSANVERASDFRKEEGATVSGKTDIVVQPQTNRFATADFYIWKLVGILAALAAGVLGMRLFPEFLGTVVESMRSWRNLGRGVAIVILTPIAGLLLAITVVGLPVSMLVLGVYGFSLFLAKALVGGYLGRELTGWRTDSRWRSVGIALLGLTILSLLAELPLGAGTVIEVAVLSLGCGALVSRAVRAA